MIKTKDYKTTRLREYENDRETMRLSDRTRPLRPGTLSDLVRDSKFSGTPRFCVPTPSGIKFRRRSGNTWTAMVCLRVHDLFPHSASSLTTQPSSCSFTVPPSPHRRQDAYVKQNIFFVLADGYLHKHILRSSERATYKSGASLGLLIKWKKITKPKTIVPAISSHFLTIATLMAKPKSPLTRCRDRDFYGGFAGSLQMAFYTSRKMCQQHNAITILYKIITDLFLWSYFLLRHEEILHQLTNDGESVKVQCRIEVDDGPYEMGTDINGTVEFTTTKNLSFSEYTLQAICYVGKTLPFDRVATEFPLKVFTCQANSTISIPFSFNLPICVPSYRGPYPFEVSWYIALYHSEVPTCIQIELPVNTGASLTFTPEWMKPATASIFSWGVLFWVIIAGLGLWIFPLALDELRRESKDPVGIIFSVLFCLAALGLPEILFRLYTRFFRLITLPFNLLIKLFGKKLFKFDKSIIIEGIHPGATQLLNVTSKLKTFTVQVIGTSYWGYGSDVKIKKLKNRPLYSFFPVYFESRKKFYSSGCKIDATTPKYSEDISERNWHLHLYIPQDVPFSYVKNFEGICWELVFTWKLFGIPFSVPCPLRLIPRN